MTLDELVATPNVAAFLRVIREGESSQDESAYLVMFGGGHFVAPPWEHPRQVHVVNNIASTAAGAYQFLQGTWDLCKGALQLPDFSPHSQDLAAVWLIKRREALDHVIRGELETALAKCGHEWASLPGSPYGQPTITLQRAKAVYLAYGGTLSDGPIQKSPETALKGRVDGPNPQPATPVAKTVEKPMLPVLGALLPTIVQAIPSLIGIFGKGARAEQNAKAAQVVADTVVEATKSVNLQEAAEKITNDAAAAEAARKAIEDNPYLADLMEVGEGGVKEARKAAADPAQIHPWQNPAMWVTAALLPLVYIVVWTVVRDPGSSEQLRTVVVTAVISGLLGSVTGFWLGTSLSSQRKTEILANRS